jgi:hypothetical protein
MLQVATIIGAMLARSYGTTAPWLILIGLKTLADYQRPPGRPLRATGTAVKLSCPGVDHFQHLWR